MLCGGLLLAQNNLFTNLIQLDGNSISITEFSYENMMTMIDKRKLCPIKSNKLPQPQDP